MIGNTINDGAIIPPHPTDGYAPAYIIGYFAFAIVGALLLYFGYKAKSNSEQ